MFLFLCARGEREGEGVLSAPARPSNGKIQRSANISHFAALWHIYKAYIYSSALTERFIQAEPAIRILTRA